MRDSAVFYVYLHCKPDGALFYVGKGCGKRAWTFEEGRNKLYREVVANLGGAKNVQVVVLPCSTDEDACFTETQLIRAFRLIGYQLANKSDGGEALGTKAALAAAKARGTQLGGRRVSAARWAEIREKADVERMRAAGKRAADLMPAIRAVQAQGAKSLRQIAAGLNERNVPAPRGGDWSAVQVQRVRTAAKWHQANQENPRRVEQ